MFLLDRRNFLQLSAAGALSFTPGFAQAATAKADVFTSEGDGLFVDSTVVMGDDSAVLIDAQFTAGNAAALADVIAATGRKLESIIITHFHPDHLLGLPVLLDRFPEAKAYAHRDVHALIGQTLAPMHAEIAGGAPAGAFAASFAMPDVLQNDHIMLEGERIEVLPPMAGDTALITPVHVPAIDTLIASDVAFADTHLWMEEAIAPGGVEAWRDSVKALQSIGAGTVIPGHRKADSANDASVLEATLSYLARWEAALAASTSAEEMKAALLIGTESHGFGFALDRSVSAAFPE